MKPKKWNGTKPVKCDLCDQPYRATDQYFYDFKTSFGPWALGCQRCFKVQGGSLGLGCGQKYDLKTMVKLEG